jgi:hypothetical protein
MYCVSRVGSIFDMTSALMSFVRHGISPSSRATFVMRGRRSIDSSATTVRRAQPAAGETCRLRARLLARQTGVALFFVRFRKHLLEQKLNSGQYLTFRIVRHQEIQTLLSCRETAELV